MALIELEVSIPQELSAIKLQQYQKYLSVAKNVDEGDKDNEFLNLKALEIFCGLTLKESYGLPVSMFESVLKQVGACFQEKTDLVQRFKMTGSDGVTAEFGFIPNLDKMSFGEYIDLESYISDWDNMHKAMAVMYRPIVAGKKHLYEIEPYQGTERWEEVMKDAPVNVALGAIVFFYRLGSKLSRYTMNSLLEEEEKTGNTVLKQALEESGVGINQYMDSLEVMYSNLTQLPKFHYTPA
tara:strand:+ start:841 stop:1557 length:717 start_codon:yes stop_codon:yes gene_type:complete